MKNRYKEDFVVFLLGGTIYPLIELSTRGYTHWTMAVLAGSIFVILYRYNSKFPKKALWKKCIFGMAVITSLEFLVGCIANLGFGWKVWDYSNCPLNVLGQICLPFSAIWFALSAPAILLCSQLEKALKKPSNGDIISMDF